MQYGYAIVCTPGIGPCGAIGKFEIDLRNMQATLISICYDQTGQKLDWAKPPKGCTTDALRGATFLDNPVFLEWNEDFLWIKTALRLARSPQNLLKPYWDFPDFRYQ